MVTSKFDEDLIKNERTSLEIPFSHYGKFFRCSRAPNSVWSGPIWPKLELIRDFMPVLVTCKFEKNLIKTTEKRWRHHFPHYKSMGTFCCHGNQSFVPKPHATFPHPNDASYQIWPTLAKWPQRYSSFIGIMTERQNDRTTEFREDKAIPV